MLYVITGMLRRSDRFSKERKFQMTNEAFEWKLAWVRGQFLKRIKKITKNPLPFNTYAGRKLLDVEEGSKAIYDLIMSGKPCMVCRYGANELDIVSASMAYPEISKSILLNRIKKGTIYTNAGFFPKGFNYILDFSEVMKSASKEADFIGVWFNTMEDYVISKCTSSNTQIGLLRSIEPWYSKKNKWTAALKGKKVLVIHPFSETIQAQYEKRNLLFQDERMLPEFTLLTQTAVQTVADEEDDRFSTWFDALNYMYEEAMEKDFDVAILGCGAYGFPLAAKLKQAGKQAIHMGGATQLLFGIKGSRWDNHPVISNIYNDNWVRPSLNERPKNADKIEGGCYW